MNGLLEKLEVMLNVKAVSALYVAIPCSSRKDGVFVFNDLALKPLSNNISI